MQDSDSDDDLSFDCEEQSSEEDKLADDDIPQGISQEQIDTACMVLERLKGHISSKSCRKLRQALHPWVKELSGRMYHGGSKEDYDRKIAADKQKTSLKHQMRRLDEEYINAVTLRKKRVDALKKLLEEQPGREAFPLIADGAAESAVPGERGQRLLQSGGRGDTKEKRDGQGGSTSLLVGEAEEAKSAEPYHGKEGEIEMGGQEDDGSSQVMNMKDTNGESARRKEKKQQQQQQQQQQQKQVSASSSSQLTTSSSSSSTTPPISSSPPPMLNRPRSCYICKKRYRQLHHFYDALCPDCSSLNFQKRFSSKSLTGKVAIVTGGRVKIGYHVALKLLRAGCHTIVTTRFPSDAATRFAKESDFATWKGRLDIYGLDFRNVAALESFCAFVKTDYPRLDILINNACQTIRRPIGYYTGLVKEEQRLHKHTPQAIAPLLARQRTMVSSQKQQQQQQHIGLEKSEPQRRLRPPLPSVQGRETTEGDGDKETGKKTRDDTPHSLPEGEEANVVLCTAQQSACSNNHHHQSISITSGSSSSSSSSFMSSQMPLTKDDVKCGPTQLPVGLKDVNNQQLDVRKCNSWLLKIDQVETPEIAEVFVINAMAPFVLNSKLIPFMRKSGPGTRKFIINVSAMEGKFYRHKLPTHPHTNMAKAALNMMTRTCSSELAKENILMNSVDTGWINDENPIEKAADYAKKSNFQTPIDEIDAAARILDPVFMCVDDIAAATSSTPLFGLFFKDYHETEW